MIHMEMIYIRWVESQYEVNKINLISWSSQKRCYH